MKCVPSFLQEACYVIHAGGIHVSGASHKLPGGMYLELRDDATIMGSTDTAVQLVNVKAQVTMSGQVRYPNLVVRTSIATISTDVCKAPQFLT